MKKLSWIFLNYHNRTDWILYIKQVGNISYELFCFKVKAPVFSAAAGTHRFGAQACSTHRQHTTCHHETHRGASGLLTASASGKNHYKYTLESTSSVNLCFVVQHVSTLILQSSTRINKLSVAGEAAQQEALSVCDFAF